MVTTGVAWLPSNTKMLRVAKLVQEMAWLRVKLPSDAATPVKWPISKFWWWTLMVTGPGVNPLPRTKSARGYPFAIQINQIAGRNENLGPGRTI
jgi:hypothetical protein